MRLTSPTLLLTLLFACTPEPQPRERILPPDDPIDETPVVEQPIELASASDSGRFVSRHDGDGVLLADPDVDGVLWFQRSAASGKLSTVSGEPTRIVRVGERYFVTLRASGELAELSVAEDEPATEVRRVPVGAEPFDVAVSRDLSRIYVSLSLEDAVVALDATTLTELARWSVPFEPRWIEVGQTAEGLDRVFVASVRDPLITEIRPDAPAGQQVSAHPLPIVPRSIVPGCADVSLSMRITGELELNEAGDALWIPALYADTSLDPSGASAANANDTGFVPDPCIEVVVPPSDVPPSPWGVPPPPADPAIIGQLNPAIVKLAVGDGVQTEAIALGTATRTGVRVDLFRSYPTGIELLHGVDGAEFQVMVTMESADVLVNLDLRRPTVERSGALTTYRRTIAGVSGAPTALRYDESDPNVLWVWSWLDRKMRSYNASTIAEAVSAGRSVEHASATAERSSPTPTTISEAAQRGRKHFYTSIDRRVVGAGGGVSCSTCHPDARSDGFTWFVEGLVRQAPSLHGDVSSTSPVGWRGNVESVKHEVMLTTSTRTAGTGLGEQDALDVVAFIDSTRDIVPPAIRTDTDRELVALGRELFSREDVGCVECHSGDQGTDNENHEVFGEDMNTPRLRGIAGSGPYFRDGTARTLRDVLLRARDGSMGDTSMLSEAELTALEAYLRRF